MSHLFDDFFRPLKPPAPPVGRISLKQLRAELFYAAMHLTSDKSAARFWKMMDQVMALKPL